jgi:hypothetical protein
MVNLRYEGPPVIETFVDEIEDVTALAEVGTFCADQQRPDIGLAGFADGAFEGIGEVCRDEIRGRIGQDDMAYVLTTFKIDAFH